MNLDNTVDKLDSPTLIKEYINNKNSENPKELETNIGIKKTVENIQTILDNQSLKINETQTFKLKLKYLTSEENQIEDSGKTINAKISFEQFSK